MMIYRNSSRTWLICEDNNDDSDDDDDNMI